VTYAKDMVLFKEGDPGEALYLVVDGSVRVSKTAPGSADQAMAFMERGSCFGEMALVDEFPRSATAVANQESRILFIEKQAFLNFLEQHPVVGRKILWAFCRSLSMRLREASDRIVALSSFTVRSDGSSPCGRPDSPEGNAAGLCPDPRRQRPPSGDPTNAGSGDKLETAVDTGLALGVPPALPARWPRAGRWLTGEDCQDHSVIVRVAITIEELTQPSEAPARAGPGPRRGCHARLDRRQARRERSHA
jgi:CRP-like cAMP-binding protein